MSEEDVAVWRVVGGGDKGGILVREGCATSSPQASGRLATGALVRELELVGERLRYERLTGEGPPTGWVSLQLAGPTAKDLVARAPGIWKVVGGGDKGGIVARQGVETTSALEPERLSTGSLLSELELQGERLRYERLTGSGPQTGWVSLKLQSGKELVVRSAAPSVSASNGEVAAAQTSATAAAPDAGSVVGGCVLDIRQRNEDLGFSFEGLPIWVPRAAAVARLQREGTPYLPLQEPPPERFHKIKGLPGPYKKLPPNKFKEAFKVHHPGAFFGIRFPHSAEELESESFGAAWLTEALHAAGTLPENNKVERLIHVKELPMAGYDKAGGAAMKCFITVAYARPDPELHTELFAKYSFDPNHPIPGVITMGTDDSLEVNFAILAQHALPFRSPKFYFADLSRENNTYVLITECIPYGRQGEEEKAQPYDILPGCGKCQDYLLRCPEGYYCAMFRAMGQLAGWDKRGHFDGLLGPLHPVPKEGYLAEHRPTSRKRDIEDTRSVVGQGIDIGIDFLLNWAKNMAPPELRDEAKLQKMKAEMLEMSPWFNDMSGSFQVSDVKYIAANHANLQADNAFFWRDEYSELACGMLDWGGFSRGPFCVRFLGCLSGADVSLMLGHEEGILRCFVDEYARCGGPQLDVADVRRRYHLALITHVYASLRFLREHTLKETTQEEFRAFTGVGDERFQERFYTRCGCLPTINTWSYYIQSDFKKLFDEWSRGDGQPFMTRYE